MASNKPEFSESAIELYESAPCGYVSFLHDGSIFNLNTTFLLWIGYSKAEVIGSLKLSDLFSMGGKIYFETHFFPLIQMQGSVNEVYFNIKRKDGSEFPALINVKTVRDEVNRETIYRASIVDITQRKKYEDDLIQAKKRAEDESKSKARFLYTVSHEIRTPLNAILGIGNLLNHTPLNEKQKEYARILLMSSENLIELVNNLLDLSKIEAKKLRLEKKPFNLHKEIDVLYHSLKAKADEKNIVFNLYLGEKLPNQLLGDALKLNQILTNLLGNSIKFTDEGKVELHVTLLDKKGKYATLRFRVKDTGIGISKQHQKRVFQEFSQANHEINKKYGGTGLGLNICKKLVNLHESDLHLESELGKGSVFTFDIIYEINKSEVEATVKPESSQGKYAFDDNRVLVVDDNSTNIFITAEYLNQWGVPHDSSTSSTEAIELIKTQQFDLILMDLEMPEMNGYQTTEVIRSLPLSQQPIVVAFSASKREDLAADLKKYDINDYLPKPFQPKQLWELLIFHLKHSNFKSQLAELEKGKTTNTNFNTKKKLYTVDRYLSMANNNPEYANKFLKQALIGIEEYEAQFETIVKHKDIDMLSNLIHQSTMSLFYLDADIVMETLEKYREILTERPNKTKQITKVSAECLSYLKEIKIGLRDDLSKLD